MNFPRDIKQMIPVAAEEIKKHHSSETAWPIFIQAYMSTVGGPDRWENMEKVVNDLIGLLKDQDRVVAVIAALCLGATGAHIKNSQLNDKAILAIADLGATWPNENLVRTVCYFAWWKLGDTEVTPKWFDQIKHAMGLRDNDKCEVWIMQSVIYKITNEGWR
jgi:hypothetical protein